ncbi:uncharacterized protein TNIN_351901 [Trichonephila inaurata madagascariensis]|uniref:Gustatory receptor n=1 Tax=Trichonephila inaurata madagascariensis TaxID=2747483 RepID=A0A8X6Y8M8_9ARAC|nr:uncharacterized protein TNIN_351901 [Trichonephila inaurata madagascariensis]
MVLSMAMYMNNAVLSTCVMVTSANNLLHRYILIKKLNRLEKISNILGEFTKCGNKSEGVFWIKMLIILNVSSNIIILSYKLLIGGIYADVSYFFFGFHFQDKLFNDIVSSLFDIYSFLFDSLPMMSFAFLYIAVCNDMRYIAKHFIKSLRDNNNRFKYEEILHSYSAIKSTANGIDNTIGVLVFTTLISNSGFLCSSLYVALQPNKFPNPVKEISIFYSFLTNFALFIMMTASASSVSEASSVVGSVALIMPEDKRASFNHQRFITLAEKEITLTVWKISPINRSFIFGIIGIIFTYVIMFQALSPFQKP